MKCPNDGETLAMTTREGIEIDYCPACRGVWLDRGELDKIIERSAAVAATPAAPASPAEYGRRGAPEARYDDDDDRERRAPQLPYGDRDDRYEHGRHGKGKRRSFLGDLFDFD